MKNFLAPLLGLFIWLTSALKYINGILQTCVLIFTLLGLILGALEKLGLLDSLKTKIKRRFH